MTPLRHEQISALAKRIGFLRMEMEALKKQAGMKLADYRANDVARRNVERIIENLINASLDVVKILLSGEDVPFPERARDAFDLLADMGILSRDAAKVLADKVRLRNILAHEYLDFRWRQIEDFITNATDAVRALIESTEALIHDGEKN